MTSLLYIYVTSWGRVLLGTLIIAKLLQKFFPFRNSEVILQTSKELGSYFEIHKFSQNHKIPSLKPILKLSYHIQYVSQVGSSFQDFRLKFCMRFSTLPCCVTFRNILSLQLQIISPLINRKSGEPLLFCCHKLLITCVCS